MKHLIKNSIFIFCVTILFSSCCTFSDFIGLNSADNSLFIDSKLPGSKVYLNNKFVGYTPYQHKGNKANIKTITVKNDYDSETQKTERKNKGSIYWNFAPWPMYNWIWGYFLDRANGKGRKYTKHHYVFDI